MVGQIEDVDDSRGKACSAEFMRRLERMVTAHEGKHKDLVKFIAGQTCLQSSTIYQLVQTLNLQNELSEYSEKPQPGVLIQCLSAPNPKALAIQAIEEGWAADQTRQAMGDI